MLMVERFRQLLPEVARIKRVARDGETLYWEVYDESGSLIGYAFYVEVPETIPDVPEAEEFDKYEVLGIMGLNYEITALDIAPHPQGPEKLWAEDIVEAAYEKQYVGLSAEEIRLGPEGKIDAISDASLSSALVTVAIRNKLEAIVESRKQPPG